MTRLVLGTAQLGLEYGVGNVTGRPSPAAASALLRRAETEGVSALDTAPGYGNAEELVARAGIRLPVFTKLNPDVSPRQSLETSLRRLGRPSVEIVFLHRPELVEADTHGVIDQALRLRGELFDSLGASVYTTSQFRAAVDDPRIAAIQAPISVADQRLIRSGLLTAASDAGKRVIARSVYLQGALTLEPTSLPPHLSELAPCIRATTELATAAGLNVADVLLRFVREVEGVTDVLLGCESEHQLTAASLAFGGPPIAAALQAQLHDIVVDAEHLLDPRRWPTG